MFVWSNSSSGMCVCGSHTTLLLYLDLFLRCAAIPLKVMPDFYSSFSQKSDFTGNSCVSSVCFPDMLVLHGAIGGPERACCGAVQQLGGLSSNRAPLSRESGTCRSTPPWLSPAL